MNLAQIAQKIINENGGAIPDSPMPPAATEIEKMAKVKKFVDELGRNKNIVQAIKIGFNNIKHTDIDINDEINKDPFMLVITIRALAKKFGLRISKWELDSVSNIVNTLSLYGSNDIQRFSNLDKNEDLFTMGKTWKSAEEINRLNKNEKATEGSYFSSTKEDIVKRIYGIMS